MSNISDISNIVVFFIPGFVPRNEKMQKLEKGIAALPEHYRIMLVLRHQEDLSYEEIADSLSIPLGTVKARIHRAREMLKTILEGEDFFA